MACEKHVTCTVVSEHKFSVNQMIWGCLAYLRRQIGMALQKEFTRNAILQKIVRKNSPLICCRIKEERQRGRHAQYNLNGRMA